MTISVLSLQVENKGMVSYRDPESAPGRGQKTLHVTSDMDLTKMFVRALKEIGAAAVAAAGLGPDTPLKMLPPDAGWARLADVERHIRKSFAVDVSLGQSFIVLQYTHWLGVGRGMRRTDLVTRQVFIFIYCNSIPRSIPALTSWSSSCPQAKTRP